MPLLHFLYYLLCSLILVYLSELVPVTLAYLKLTICAIVKNTIKITFANLCYTGKYGRGD